MSLLHQIEQAELLLQNLKRKAKNSASGADAALECHDKLVSQIINIKNAAEEVCSEYWMDLYNYLIVASREEPPEKMWSEFRRKLEKLKRTGAYFRRNCFHRISPLNGCNILHEMCQRDPPADVVKLFLDLVVSDGIRQHFVTHRVERGNRDQGGRYHRYTALQILVQNTCSDQQVVRMLVDADDEHHFTLKMDDGNLRGSVFHLLAAHRDKHKPEVFSKILHYLIPRADVTDDSPLLKVNIMFCKTPIKHLWDNLREDGLTCKEILRDKDFTFLLKATCYHHFYKDYKDEVSYERSKEIERIPAEQAFLICASCFDKQDVSCVLGILFSSDDPKENLLLRKDKWGNVVRTLYPIHGMIMQHDYFIDSVSQNSGIRSTDFCRFMVKTLLEICPQLARQRCEKTGKYPLHFASDLLQTSVTSGNRLGLVQTIFAAYPEAACIFDRTGLPHFALALRGDGNRRFGRMSDPFHCPGDPPAVDRSLSSAFFLLRQHPEVIADMIQQCSKSKPPTRKRRRKNSGQSNKVVQV